MERYDGRLPADYDSLLFGAGNRQIYSGGDCIHCLRFSRAGGGWQCASNVTMRYLNCDEDIMKMSVPD